MGKAVCGSEENDMLICVEPWSNPTKIRNRYSK